MRISSFKIVLMLSFIDLFEYVLELAHLSPESNSQKRKRKKQKQVDTR